MGVNRRIKAMIVKHFVCIITILIVMPITAAAGLLIFGSENWGGGFTFLNILGLGLFGLISVQLWITFIPVLIATPIIMNHLYANDLFHIIPLWKFIILSLVTGASVGILILSPNILLSLFKNSIAIMLNWVWAGAFSGAITFTIIALIYRKL